MVNVGKMIAAIRKERGMSQSMLANKLNISKQAVSNYERGKREPDYVTLEAIADILNTPMSMLISREEQETALSEIYAGYTVSMIQKPMNLTSDEIRLVNAYRLAIPVIQNAALAMLEANPM